MSREKQIKVFKDETTGEWVKKDEATGEMLELTEKDKAITGMIDVLESANLPRMITNVDIAIPLCEAGYRKQSEGVWIYNPDGIDWGLGAWQCSLCGCNNNNLPYDKDTNPLVWAGTKFCPNCGAKMKGGGE